MPNNAINIPHFKVPFNFREGSAVCVEQDSLDDVEQCVEAAIRTPRGFRLELPEFGIDNPVLAENGPSLNELQASIEQYEPRAALALSKKRFEDILSQQVEIQVSTRTESQ